MKNNDDKLEEKLKEFMFIPRSIKDVLKMKFAKNPFLVEGLIPEKGITIISGQHGCGKSWITLHIIQCIASQKNVFGKFKTKKATILLIDGETGFAEIQRRLRLMNFRADRKIYIQSQEDIKLDDKKELDKIIDHIKQEGINLVVLDPLIALHNCDENVATEMQKVMNAIKKITYAGAAVLVVHHHRKKEDGPSHPSQNIRGSSAIHGAVDSHIEVRNDDGEFEVVMLSQHKSRMSQKIPPFIVRTEEENGLTFRFVDFIEKRFSVEQQAKNIILANLQTDTGVDLQVIKSKLNEAVKISDGKLRKILKELEVVGKIKTEKLEHNRFLYFKIENPVS